MTTTFAVVGIHGFGAHHLRELAGLRARGLARVIAVADPRGADGVPDVPTDARVFSDLATLLTEVTPDVVVIATPIHTHLPLARLALLAGANVLLEKPTTASLAEHATLVSVVEETGLACQVGFQSFGSHAFTEIDRVVASGEVGDVVGIGGVGTWRRNLSYYARSAWAGRRVMDGRAVVDGVVTNPLAHAVATALRIDHATTADDVAEVEVDLFRANDIEADDTSAVRLLTRHGTPIALGLTLCSTGDPPPRVVVQGTAGRAELFYTDDELRVTTAAGSRSLSFGRTSLLVNLVEHLSDPSTPLLADVRDTGAFMRVLEAVRTAPDPAPIPPAHVDWLEDERGRHPVVRDVDEWCERVAAELSTFTRLGAPWTRPTA